MRKSMSSVVFGAVLACAASAQAADAASVVLFEEDAAPDARDADRTTADEGPTRAVAEPSPAAPLGSSSRRGADGRYRYQNGRWWYRSQNNQWLLWNGTRWSPYRAGPQSGGASAAAPRSAGSPLVGGAATMPEPGRQASSAFGGGEFNTWFNSYRGFSTGRGRLQTAESGEAEMATSEISAGEATEGFEVGGLPRSQVRRRRAGVGRALSGTGSWFNSGSPFGIRYGYGSGFGYGGYGFDSPYGYGSRTGSGGAYGYGFGEFGSVGGQTGERLSSLISGPVEEGGRLIGPEPAGMGAPARLESSVGGTYGKAGSGARQLGGSAAESSD